MADDIYIGLQHLEEIVRFCNSKNNITYSASSPVDYLFIL